MNGAPVTGQSVLDYGPKRECLGIPGQDPADDPIKLFPVYNMLKAKSKENTTQLLHWCRDQDPVCAR